MGWPAVFITAKLAIPPEQRSRTAIQNRDPEQLLASLLLVKYMSTHGGWANANYHKTNRGSAGSVLISTLDQSYWDDCSGVLILSFGLPGTCPA